MGQDARARPVSIVIPTLNAGPSFGRTLEALRNQAYGGRVEVIVIDSASTDETLNLAKQRGATTISIRRQEFDHGLTRNRAIQSASGEIVLLLSQDALPGDDRLIASFVSALEDPRVAGAFGRQVPRSEADVLTKQRLGIAQTGRLSPEVHWIGDWDAYRALEPLPKYFFCCFDNVCSAIRKSVWEAHPFRESEFGEDIEWGKRVLEAGWKIAYCPEAFVVHSHRRTMLYEYRRNFAGHRILRELFGVHLVPRWSDVLAATRLMIGHDVPYVRQNEPRRTRRLRTVLAVPFLAFAAVYGQYRGARAAQQAQSHRARGGQS